MRIETSVTSLSWIPSEAVAGFTKLPFEMGMTHYDPPPPDVVGDLEALRADDRFRFANQLKAWIEVDEGAVTDCGYSGGGQIGSSTVRLGPLALRFAAVAFPDLQSEPVVSPGAVRFTQTAGGRTGIPAPRHVKRPPFVQLTAPLAWSTLSLTIRADGSTEHALVGASPFPRHWVYDGAGRLAAKSGMIDFTDWYRSAFGSHSPWGDSDSPALVTVAETALEREMSATIMGGRRPEVRRLATGAVLVEQGQPGQEIFLLLDGVLTVEVDGQRVAEVGPGAVVGERAVLEGGRRSATLRAVTPAKVAVAPAELINREALEDLSSGHRREEFGNEERPPGA